MPEGYKHRCCEKYRNEQAQKTKDFGKGTLSVATTVGSIVLAIITKGKMIQKVRHSKEGLWIDA